MSYVHINIVNVTQYCKNVNVNVIQSFYTESPILFIPLQISREVMCNMSLTQCIGDKKSNIKYNIKHLKT